MNTTCIDPKSQSSNLIAIDFDPFASGDQQSGKFLSVTKIQALPTSSVTKASKNEEFSSETTWSTPNIISTNLRAVDFDPFIDGEILLTAPATESQKEIWLSVQMSDQANLACILSQSLRLKGKLNLCALREAFQQLVIRHESLRITFSGDGSTVLIAKSIALSLSMIDLSDLDTQKQAENID